MTRTFRKIVSSLLVATMLHSTVVFGATTDLATSPLVTSPSSSVLPNLMFILDDSGSMDWDYLPDWANSGTTSRFRNAEYNGVFYNPAVTYTPPTFYNADGTLNTTTYPSQTAANTRGSCAADWCAVKRDGYGIQSTSTDNLVGSAYFYTYIAGEFCNNVGLRNFGGTNACSTQTAATSAFPFPAKLRWCTSSAHTSCQAVRIESGTTFLSVRIPGEPGASMTLTVASGGTGSGTSLSSLLVGDKEILSATTNDNTTTSTIADRVRDGINACTSAATGNCTVSGYSASSSGAVVTVFAPSGTVPSGLVTHAKVGDGSFTPVNPTFATGTPGSNVRTDIVSTTTSYPYPGSTTKSITRTDCAAATCTYVEEMTNYANWWAYYHTRMQMMKTAASIAFQQVDDKYRVGFMTLNGNSTNAFVNISKFDSTQKLSWYQKFFAANPNNSTPLRQALSTAGRIYAGKYNGSSIDGVTVVDPVQYSCQQNFTILSSDGYWNGTGGAELGGGAMGNHDGGQPRPYSDGAQLVDTAVTPTVTVTVNRSIQNVNRNTAYTRTNTTIGAACTTPGTQPSSCVVDNGNNSSDEARKWCVTTGTSGCNSNNECQTLGATSLRMCRGTSNSSNNPPCGSPAACQTSGADTYCIYNNNTTTGTTACQRSNSVDPDNSSQLSDIYACKPPAGGTGNMVTVTNQSYTRVEGGSITTETTTTATTNSTTVTTNGVAAPAQANTPAATSNTVNNAGFPAAAVYTTDNGAPTGATTWTNGSSTGPTCVATASLPTAGPSAATAGTPAVANSGSPTVSTLSTTGPTVGTTVVTTSFTGGNSDTLADVAQYYYGSDLRTSTQGNCTGVVVPPNVAGLDVCTNDVKISGTDAASHQHMTTFTLALGINGVMQYLSNYLTATSGDFFDVKNGTAANPAAGVCAWQSSGACNWPTPSSDSQKNVDDMWHAAVNGRGQYFSATNPATLSSSLNSAIAGVNAAIGSSAAATTSNPNVTSGDNFVFSSTFTTQTWDGQLIRQQLDLVTGVVSSTVDWSAQAQLDSKLWSDRLIYTFDSGAANKLKLFTYANLDPTTEQVHFNLTNISTGGDALSQMCASGASCLSDQTVVAGANLVNYLRGERTNEGVSTDIGKSYRQRAHILGDIVNAEAVYVKTPLLSYADTDFSAYVSAQAGRQGMVYVAGNDGMLHAFNADTGAEAWSYVPTLTFPKLFKVADKNYSSLHRYYVDGTPIAGDIYHSSTWKTIVVAGMNGGGNGYYALDVTTPNAPKALWEYTDADMGFTYGNPVVTKLTDGTWVVIFTTGYNNADGIGRLKIVNAGTGVLIRTISTAVGDPATPSGLARINAWVDNAASDNTTLRVYGGDMLGNLWRFDINDTIAPSGYEAQLLISLKANVAGTISQPITTKPELGEVNSTPVIFVGTGRFLGLSDVSDTTQQSFYAVKDALGTTTLINPRAVGSKFIQQTHTTTTCPAGSPATICSAGQVVRVSTDNPVSIGASAGNDNGWFIDLPESKERANTDPTLALGTLGFTTNVPSSSVCSAGGTSFRYLVDYKTGGPLSTSTTKVAGVMLGNALATRAVFVRLPNNTVVQLTRLSDGTTLTTNVPIGAGASPTRRISWRELISDQ